MKAPLKILISDDQDKIVINDITYGIKEADELICCGRCDIARKFDLDTACIHIPCISDERFDDKDVYLLELDAHGKPVRNHQ